jgi:hypothetical protein
LLTCVLREWVPIRGRYVIIGGVVEGIGQIKPVKILEEGTLPKIPGRDSTEYLMRRENPTWDSGPVIAGNSGGARFLNFLAYTPTTLGNFPLGSFHWSEVPLY